MVPLLPAEEEGCPRGFRLSQVTHAQFAEHVFVCYAGKTYLCGHHAQPPVTGEAIEGKNKTG